MTSESQQSNEKDHMIADFLSACRDRETRMSAQKARTPPDISPPPLKRQRSDAASTGVRTTNGRKLGSSFENAAPNADDIPGAINSPYNTHRAGNKSRSPRMTRESLNPYGDHAITNTSGSGAFAAASALSHANHHQKAARNFSASVSTSTLSTVQQLHVRDDDDKSTSSTRTSSGASAGSNSHTMTCRVCNKTTNCSYNPLVSCSTCNRSFHEACRIPLLSKNPERNGWRCYKCLAKDANVPLHTTVARKGSRDLVHRDRTSTLSSLASDSSSTNSFVARTQGNNATGAQSMAHGKATGSSPISLHERVARFQQKQKNAFRPITKPNLNLFPNAIPGPTSETISRPISGSHGPEADMAQSLDSLNVPSRDPKKLETAKPVQKISRANASEDALVAALIGDEELEAAMLSSSAPHTAFSVIGSSSSTSVTTTRLEVPNTPSQNSSQLPPSSILRDQTLPGGYSTTRPKHVDSPAIRSMAEPYANVACTIKCSVCRKRRVLAKGDNTTPICRPCKYPRMDMDNDQSLIFVPETPEAQANKGASSQSEHSADQGASSSQWYQSKVVNPKKIVRKSLPRLEAPQTTVPPSPGKISTDESYTKLPFAEAAHQGPEAIETGSKPQQTQETDAVSDLISCSDEELDTHEESLVDRNLILAFQTDGKGCRIVNRGIVVSPELDVEAERDVEVAAETQALTADQFTHLGHRDCIAVALLINGPSTASEITTYVLKSFPSKYCPPPRDWNGIISGTLSQHKDKDFRGARVEGQRAQIFSFLNTHKQNEYADKMGNLVTQLSGEALGAVGGLCEVDSNRPLKYQRMSIGQNAFSRKEDRSSPVETSKGTIGAIRVDSKRSGSVRVARQSAPTSDSPANPTKSMTGDDKVAAINESTPVRMTWDKSPAVSFGALPMSGIVSLEQPPDAANNGSQLPDKLADMAVGEVAAEPTPKPVPNEGQKGARAESGTDKYGSYTLANWYEVDSSARDPDLHYETDFTKAYPDSVKEYNISIWTTAEKKNKIEQIKARPSRKSMFGKRLAFARYHREGDIHNMLQLSAGERERRIEKLRGADHDDGQAWASNSEEDSDGEAMSPDREHRFTEVLGLPQNPKPMTTQDKALAFKDGDRTGRSRDVYRVSKR